MPVIDFFGADKRLEVLTIRVSELEARQVRIEKALARQRKINESLLAIMENVNWENFQTAVDTALAIE